MKATVHKKKDARLADIPVAGIGERLAGLLPWIDNIYGICERLARKTPDGSLCFYPAWPEAGGYAIITPDGAEAKNYCFFVTEDPMRILGSGKYEIGMSLVVWGDMRKVSGERNIEKAKEDVLYALRKARTPSGRFVAEEVYERSENVFKGFTMPETANQYMMHPYFALRIYGKLYMNEICY